MTRDYHLLSIHVKRGCPRAHGEVGAGTNRSAGGGSDGLADGDGQLRDGAVGAELRHELEGAADVGSGEGAQAGRAVRAVLVVEVDEPEALVGLGVQDDGLRLAGGLEGDAVASQMRLVLRDGGHVEAGDVLRQPAEVVHGGLVRAVLLGEPAAEAGLLVLVEHHGAAEVLQTVEVDRALRDGTAVEVEEAADQVEVGVRAPVEADGGPGEVAESEGHATGELATESHDGILSV